MGDAEFLRKMGQRIMVRRKGLQLTQEGLAERMSVSTQMMSNLEPGKKAMRPENLARLCEHLQVSADFILYSSDNDSRIDDAVEKLPHLADAELQIVCDMIDALNNNRA